MPYTQGTPDPIGLVDEPVPFCEHTEAGLVYFIGPVGEDGPVKIGFTEKLPRKRLGDLQTGSPVRLELYVAIPAERREEAYLHSCFRDERMHGEWFTATPRLREAIRILRTERGLFVTMPGEPDRPGSPLQQLMARIGADPHVL